MKINFGFYNPTPCPLPSGEGEKIGKGFALEPDSIST